jgi:hypothetical protein
MIATGVGLHAETAPVPSRLVKIGGSNRAGATGIAAQRFRKTIRRESAAAVIS